MKLSGKKEFLVAIIESSFVVVLLIIAMRYFRNFDFNVTAVVMVVVALLAFILIFNKMRPLKKRDSVEYAVGWTGGFTLYNIIEPAKILDWNNLIIALICGISFWLFFKIVNKSLFKEPD